MSKNQKNTGFRFGDRRDAKKVRDIDGMHFIMPLMMPNRTDSEAFVSERVDLTAASAFLEKKNAGDPEFKYTLFHLIVTAIMRTVSLRPRLNRFFANKTLYQRNDLSASFVIKKYFGDEATEGMAFLKVKEDSTLESIHEDIRRQVFVVRKGGGDRTSNVMDVFPKMPGIIAKAIVRVIRFLEARGWAPKSLIETDPFQSSVMLSNLGSIKLHSGYHHLTNWGTNSIFLIVGERKKRPFFEEDGSYQMIDSVDIGITVDERIADGYYYAKSIRLFQYLMQHPELLEEPMSKNVDFE